MTNIKEQIQKIKLARMGEEYRFVANIFSELVPHKTISKPNVIFFLIDEVPVIYYNKKANYLWCHSEIIWEPLLTIVSMNIGDDLPLYRETIKQMREIIGHFALAYFDFTGTTISMAHSFITESWKNLKFKRTYSW